MAGKCIPGVESADLSSLAEDLRRGQRAAARDREQGRCQYGGSGGDLGGEFINLDRETAEMVDESGREVRHDPGEVRHMRLNFGKGAGPIHFRGLFPPRIEFMSVPTQPSDDAGASGDKVFAVIDEEPDFAFNTIKSGDRQIRLTQSRSGDGKSVNRIGFPEAVGRISLRVVVVA